MFVLHVPKHLPTQFLLGKSNGGKDTLMENSLFVQSKLEGENELPPAIIKRLLVDNGCGGEISVRRQGIIVVFKSSEAREQAQKDLGERKEIDTKLTLQIITQVETAPALRNHLRGFYNIPTVFVSDNAAGDSTQLTFHVQGQQNAEKVSLDLWDTLQVGRGFGSMHIIRLQRSDASKKYPACVPLSEFANFSGSQRGDLKDIKGIDEGEDEDEDEEKLLDLGILHNEVANQIRQGAEFSLDFVLMIIVASLLAGVALAANNTVVVVASMLVSPLMGPILATVFGYVIGDMEMVASSLVTELFALLLCIAAGFVVGVAFSPWGDILNWPNNEMASRGTINGLLIGLGIAIPSGIGVALGILGGNTSSLVGVAISASLLPPAVNCGMCWAYAAAGPSLVLESRGGIKPEVDSSDFVTLGGISLSLTLLNIGCIYVFAYMTFKAKIHLKYPGKTDYWGFLADDLIDEHEGVKDKKPEPDIGKEESSNDIRASTGIPTAISLKEKNKQAKTRLSMPVIEGKGTYKSRRKARVRSQSMDFRRKYGKKTRGFLGGGMQQTILLRNPMNAIATGDMRKSVRLRNRRKSMVTSHGGNKSNGILQVDPQALQSARRTLKDLFNRPAKEGKKKISRGSLKTMFRPPS